MQSLSSSPQFSAEQPYPDDSPEPGLGRSQNAPTRSRTRVRVAVSVLLVAGVGLGAFALFSRKAVLGTAVPTDEKEAPHLDGNFIRFGDGFAKRVGLSTVPAQPRRLSPVVHVAGTVTYDARKFAAVGARIAGRVRRVLKVEGDHIRPHEALAEIESADLGRAEAGVMAARAKEMAADAHGKRERRLADARITTERDAELAKAEQEAARAERIAAERTVQALGGDLVGELGVLVLRSPVGGRVVSGKIVRGQTVEPRDTLYQIADLSSVWVELDVFERELGAVAVGDAVQITTQVSPGTMIKGRVDHIASVIDLQTRSARIRVVAENKDGTLRPGQSVQARITTTGPTSELLSVPRTAITRVDGKPTVFVLLDAHTVEPRAVALGSDDAQDVTISEGLRGGEQIVVGGLFALKSEIFR